ncbi:hypothetical protein MCAP1_000283 [Malassezia caprae]|uniref:Ima1 N-terminal domain-containing protein n=1 Tax=Malassezia caprae TaxID=1381934 RepID=A0AAF0E4L4_9BASI|nr:hypothetical protein MCAP1_000283 [Malassezia caprae]
MWRLGRRRQHVAACHFCGTESVIVPPYGAESALRKAAQGMDARSHPLSSGTSTRWFCAVCHMWNHRDEHGRVLDLYERPMWDADLNHDAFATRQAPARASSVFCRSCLANQTIVANLLANYLSDDDESTDTERMAAYPAYRESLEARYPVVCNACAPRVEAHLEKNHERVRSEALSYWISRHAEAASAPAESPEVPRRHRAWHATYAAFVLGAGTVGPLSMALSLPAWLCVSISAVACLPTWWDSCAAHKDRLDARAIRYGTCGERVWQVAQLLLWLLRLAMVYLWVTGADTRVVTALGALHAVLCVGAVQAYRLVPHAPLHLAPRPLERPAARPVAPVVAPPLAALSLADEPQMGAPVDTLWPAPPSPEAMDVDPEPAPRVPRDFSLAPPQFGGRMSSGLEDMFGQALRLDAPSAAASRAGRGRSMLWWPWL